MAQTIYEFCGIPSMPTIEWDGEAYFKRGIAKVKRIDGQTVEVVMTFDKKHNKPRVIYDPNIPSMGIKSIEKIFIIPEFIIKENKEEFFTDDESEGNYRLLENEFNETVETESDKIVSQTIEKSSVKETVQDDFNGVFVGLGIRTEQEAKDWLKEHGVKATHLIKNKNLLVDKIIDVSSSLTM